MRYWGTIAGFALIVLLCGLWYFFASPTPSERPASKDDLIKVTTPLPNATVQSPLTIEGEARGVWYFEASFPAKILDANGALLGIVPAQADKEWMTEEYVPFHATLTFATPATRTGTLVLEKDNPSGLPENADELRIPVRFAIVGEEFSSDGNVTRNNPGQKSDVWYLVYERPGAPGLTAELDLRAIYSPPELTVGKRVHVEGTMQDSIVSVRSISEVGEGGVRIKLYYYNPSLDQGPGGAQCSRNGLVAIERTIPRTQTPLRDSIELLLRGELTDEERATGITTEFPLPGVALRSAVIENGAATLTFDDPQNRTSGGSCRAGILWFQIEATAKQFPAVTSVRFLPEELFQP